VIGYHILLFNNRFFLLNRNCLTHRPIETNQPEGFKVVNDKWPNTFSLRFAFWDEVLKLILAIYLRWKLIRKQR
jgi:hypothetical protein